MRGPGSAYRRLWSVSHYCKRAVSYFSPAQLAVLHSVLGDREQAFALLEKAYAVHDPQLIYLKVEEHYDFLLRQLRPV